MSAHLIEVEHHGNLQTNRGTTRRVVSFEEWPSLINVVTRSQQVVEPPKARNSPLAPEEIEITYLPRNDPLMILYRHYLLQRFKKRSIVIRSTPSEYGELILANGKPLAAVFYKKEKNVEFISNIEVLPEFTDSHSMMFILSAIHDFRLKTKIPGKTTIYIKQINDILVNSERGREIRTLIRDMNLDLVPI